MRNVLVLSVAAVIAGSGCLSTTGGGGTRAYVKVGSLATPPTPEDLGYVGVSSIDVDTANMGVGVQFCRDKGMGLDVGYGTLFSSTEDEALWTRNEDSEQEVYAIGLWKLGGANSPVYFQAGVGVHVVMWKWIYDYDGPTPEYKVTTGTEISFGLHGAVGIDLAPGGRFGVPLMLRIDHLLRYGGTTTVSGVVGVSF